MKYLIVYSEIRGYSDDGYALTYTEEAFDFIYKKYEPILGYNAITQYFRG